MTINPGTSISHYRILSRLGAGGMGEVYKAHDTTLDRTVALKILPTDLVENEDRVRRFVQEAKAASALNHPHIITIYEIGQAAAEQESTDALRMSNGESQENASASARGSGSIHYIAMEYVDGETLRARANRDKNDLKRMIEFLAQAADGLAKAHSSGIVHRDLKPENIMITEDGYAKILDFGLAKLMELKQSPGAGIEEAATLLMEQTRPGMVVGTVGYMSPEQVQGKEVDQRSDIFSFGCILYEAATGRKPFAGESIIDSLHKIVYSQAPPIRDLSPDTPAELQRVIRKCLSKDPDERYQSIKEVALDLREIIKEYDSLPPVSDSHYTISSTASGALQAQRRRPTGLWIAIGAVALIAIVVIAFGLSRFIARKPSRPTVTFQRMEISRLTNNGKALDAAISPDGKYAVHVMNDAGRQSLWVRQIATNSNIEIVPPTEAHYGGLSFSRDGNYIYYVRSEKTNPISELYQVPALGGTPKRIIVDVDSPISFSPDDKRFAFVRGYVKEGEVALMIANADGSGERKLTARRLPNSYGIPAWSPDGRVIACSALTNDGGERYMNVVGVRVEDGKEISITSEKWLSTGQLAWLADSSGIVMTAADRTSRLPQIWILSYPKGESSRITNDLNSYVSLSITADSSTVAAVQSNSLSNIWIVPNRDASRARQITSGAGKYNGIAWTHDGRVVCSSNASGSLDLWIMQPDGTGQKQLTANAEQNVFPSVTSDGRYIVFASNRGGNRSVFNIWRIDIDGSNPKQLTGGKGELWPECSPDGRWVVYTDIGTGKPTLWKVAIDGGSPVQLTNRFSLQSFISPDGKLIACLYWDEQPNSQISTSVIPFEGGEPIKTFSTATGRGRWTPDGRALTYVDNRGGISNIMSQSLDGGSPKQLTDFTTDQIFDFDWSRDGKQLACFRGIVTRDVILIKNLE